MGDAKMTISSERLTEIRALAEKATEGPYYVGQDEAEDTTKHRNSGLSLVDTGRQHDWPIARLCETQSANYIAAVDPQATTAQGA